MRQKRAQGSIEFLLMLGFALLFLVVMLEVISHKVSTLNKEKEQINLEDLALSIQKELEIADKSPDGYIREFKLPETLNRKEYDMTIQERELYVSNARGGITLYIPKVQGQFNKGDNTIRKNEGIVYVNL